MSAKPAKMRALDELRAGIRLRAHSLGARVFGPLVEHVYRQTWLKRVPVAPWAPKPLPPWPPTQWKTPAELRTVPGIWRDREAADRAYAERPMYSFHALHPGYVRFIQRGFGWAWLIPTAPRRLRMAAAQARASSPEQQPPAPPPQTDPHVLTEEIRSKANELGLSQVGFAPFDPKYVFAGGARHPLNNAAHEVSTGSVIVCVLEQDWKVTQTAPSARAERGVMVTMSGLTERACALADFLHERGVQAQVHALAAGLVAIHFAVEAGLGQLGLNGQLLTPRAGSRCRIAVITTNAVLEHGSPVDYGIHAICDQCQLCVKRCPTGAIPNKRAPFRGITKAKIKPDRCAPATVQAHGCAVCMKVCPVQRYGLDAVTKHLVETGTILGKGSDELEGYGWIDGRRYGPGEKPRLSREFMEPGRVIDPKRQDPPNEGSPVATLPRRGQLAAGPESEV